MSEHKTTFHYVQKGDSRTATLICTCRLTMEIDCLKVSTRMAESAFKRLHQEVVSVANEYGDDDFATPSPDPDVQDEQKGEVDND